MTEASNGDDRDPIDKREWLSGDAKGHKIVRVLRNIILAGIAIDIMVGIFIVTQVPLDTTILYTRLSRSFQIPIFALVGLPVILSLLWLRSRRAAHEPLPPNERVILLAAGIPFITFMVVGQFFLANAYLQASGQ